MIVREVISYSENLTLYLSAADASGRRCKIMEYSNAIKVKTAQSGEISDPVDKRSFLEGVYTKYHNDLKLYLVKKLGNNEDAEDVLQEVFVRLLNYTQLNSIKSAKGFLFVTARNLVRDRYRQKITRSATKHCSVDQVVLVSKDSGAEMALCSKQRWETIKKAISELQPNWRRALILHRFYGKKYTEIADDLGVTERSVQNYIKNSIKFLDNKLDTKYD